MIRILIFSCYVLLCSTCFSQSQDELKEQISGAWSFKSFELSPDKKTYHGVKEEPIFYLLFTKEYFILRGSCNIRYRSAFGIDSVHYSVKTIRGSDTLIIKPKNSGVLQNCGDIKEIKIVSCNDSILRIKSFTNDGFVNFQRMSTPEEVQTQVDSLLQGHWVYNESYSGSRTSRRSKPNSRDSIVSYLFKDDSVRVSFLNNKFNTINTTFSIRVEPYTHMIEIVIEGVEDRYCQNIPRLIMSFDQMSSSSMTTHMCSTDSDKVEFVKVE